jgi:hypothetical protein
MTPEQQDALDTETAQYAASVESLKQASEAAVQGIWASGPDWYDAAVVAALSAEAAAASTAGQEALLGATEQFITSTISLLTDTTVPIPRVSIPPVRNGAPLTLVHSRTAERFKRAFSQGASSDEAYLLALQRAGGLTRTDMTLRQRAAQIILLDELGVKDYRRVVRPEMSKSGSCGLCIVAADRIYHTDQLMPIHPPSCKCIVMPIIGALDPGRSMNEEDLRRFYDDAGGTKASDLFKTRYKVNEHGEYGPVLSKPDDNFRARSKVALEDDPDRAARVLDQALPVLQRLEAAGGPAAPLAYQRDLVARLRHIVDAHHASAA